MNREIKFRAWDSELKLMSKPFSFNQVLNFPLDNGQFHIKSVNDNHIIMQYTGLKDKNGTEIYEGDIVDFMSRGMMFRGAVKWMGCGFDAEPIGEFCKQYEHMMYFPGDIEDREIIGNRFQNSDLLKD